METILPTHHVNELYGIRTDKEFQELTAHNECRIILHSITVRIDDTTESKGFSLSCSLPDKTLH